VSQPSQPGPELRPRPSVPPAGAGGRPERGDPADATASRRRRYVWAGVAVAAVLVVVAVVVGLGQSGGGSAAAPRTPLPAGLQNRLTHVPLTALVAASTAGGAQLLPAQALHGAALAEGGKPELLYIGAESCGPCAAERWAMVVGLSQFGTFNNLAQTSSAVATGSLATFSFFGSTFSSRYLTFTAVETTTNQPRRSSYQKLESPTAAQSSLWTSVSGGHPTLPFIDFGGKYLLNASQYRDTSMEGLSFTAVADAVGSSNILGTAIDASAAAFVKYLCGVTGQQPATTCQAVAPVTAPVTGAS
jgi:Domain of unknown function (DUF929)